jgi:hypothetical protein
MIEGCMIKDKLPIHPTGNILSRRSNPFYFCFPGDTELTGLTFREDLCVQFP